MALAIVALMSNGKSLVGRRNRQTRGHALAFSVKSSWEVAVLPRRFRALQLRFIMQYTM